MLYAFPSFIELANHLVCGYPKIATPFLHCHAGKHLYITYFLSKLYQFITLTKITCNKIKIKYFLYKILNDFKFKNHLHNHDVSIFIDTSDISVYNSIQCTYMYYDKYRDHRSRYPLNLSL